MADRVLVLGASGFIGSRIVAALLARNAEVVCAGSNPGTLRRRFPACTAIAVNLSRDTKEGWASRLAASPRRIRLGPGTWRVQPTHVADVARAVADDVSGSAAPLPADSSGNPLCLRARVPMIASAYT